MLSTDGTSADGTSAAATSAAGMNTGGMNTVEKDVAHTRLQATVEEMCLTLQRASRSLYVRDAADFACAVADLSGRFIAYPQHVGVSGFLGLDLRRTIETATADEPLRPGDVLLTNDPYLSHGLSTHLPDIHAIAPYFEGDELIGYGWAFVHVSDVGGRVPSSVSVVNDSIFAEGLRIPPLRYVRAGAIVPEVEAILAANSRTAEANRGDLHAMLAALTTGRRRIAELSGELGSDGFAEVGAFARAQSAARARAALRTLQDGTYRFEDYLDNDGVGQTPLRIVVTATVADGHVHLDLTGTDPQVEAALNMVTFGEAHSWVVTRLFALIGTLDPTIPLGGGLMEAIGFQAPEGTLLNAVGSAATGVRHATTSRVNDVVSGALIQAAPEVLPAASSGLVVPVVFAARDGSRIDVVQPMVGGTGARKGSDGADGRDSGISNLSNNSVEIVESDVSVRVLRYATRPDSGGAGRWRGGSGLELEFEALADGALLARGLERLRFRPWGFAGGSPGAATELVVNEGTPREERLSIVDVHPLRAGDRVVLRTAGAGGYGDPLERDPAAVRDDVEAGFITAEHARDAYGVVLVDGEVDEEATGERRSQGVRAPAIRPEGHSLGAERDRWDAAFPPAVTDLLQERLQVLPAAVRSPRRRALVAEVLAALPDGFPVADADDAALARAAARFRELVDAVQ
ncbi:hydantoinase B/oxoprolinase family protein [Microbacterium oryzae]|uniref:hydantoinase B/oxoprolinase family protein n=1 Tax=Microbacterium oryzae TaxID=743009 RepID=UPI0025B274C5|nr:hydantoinase B/oxoprolinase family protein [Microbacterium oryzae]MDN3310832.1 hydantoinase B/oxoprolinase family protein [Microbacterium oryzae]